MFWGGAIVSSYDCALSFLVVLKYSNQRCCFFFTFALLIQMAWSLLKGLRFERQYYSTEVSDLWTGAKLA